MRLNLRISKELLSRIQRAALRAARARGHVEPFAISDTVRLAISKGLAALEAEADSVLGEEAEDASK
jgi:hypothetical protein